MANQNRFAALVAWALALRPVRVFLHYTASRGPILASGLAFQAVFATFAALWVGFSIAGLVISGDIGLRRAIIGFLAENVPGLIDSGNGGAVDPDMLLDIGSFSWASAIALVILLVTALNWLASARDAIRSIFGLPGSTTNFFLLKLLDLGIAAVFGVALLVSVLLSVAGTGATGLLLDLLGVGNDTPLSYVLGRIVTLAAMFVLDAVVLVLLFRVLSGIAIGWGILRQGVLLGAVALGLLKVLGSSLLGGAGNNPLLASFAVIIGLLIWFNLLCQVLLLAAAWIQSGMPAADKGARMSEVDS